MSQGKHRREVPNPKFTLYESCLEKGKGSVDKFEKFIPIFATLSKDHAELVMSLIIHHNQFSDGGSDGLYPYGGRPDSKKNGCMIKVENLPDVLKEVLVGYFLMIMKEG